LKIHTDFEQGSALWLYFRAGIPTASEFHHLVTPKKFEVRTGKEMDNYVARKLAEKWGGPIMGFQGGVMDQGHILEDEAIPWYEFEFDQKVRRVGFVTSDDEKIGCSPDGLLEIGGIEIKCPQPEQHVKYLLAGKVPDDYVMQVQGSMHICQCEVWRFVSYRRGFPKLVLNVQRDPAIQEALTDALDLFRMKFDEGWAYLCELNGGPPPPRPKPEPMVFADDITAGRAEEPDDLPH